MLVSGFVSDLKNLKELKKKKRKKKESYKGFDLWGNVKISCVLSGKEKCSIKIPFRIKGWEISLLPFGEGWWIISLNCKNRLDEENKKGKKNPVMYLVRNSINPVLNILCKNCKSNSRINLLQTPKFWLKCTERIGKEYCTGERTS